MEKPLFDTMDKILNNGLRLICIKRDTQIASVHAGVAMGGIYESQDLRGISHFIEHMVFKGTSTKNNEEVNKILEELGGEYNAYTDYTSTVFSTTTLNEEVDNSLSILSDMLRNSTFPKEEVEKEREVILAEIRSSKDDIEDLSFQKVNEIAFDKSPLKWDIIGREHIVKRLTCKNLKDFYNTYYVPNNTVIVVVSSYNHDEVEKMVDSYFGSWQSKELKFNPIVTEDNKNITKITEKPDSEQSTIVYLYTLHGFSKYEELAFRILNHKFGESGNSILFRKLREERGLAYDIYSSMDLTDNIKTLCIYTSVSRDNVEEAMKVIDECIRNIKEEKITFDDSTISLMKKVFKTAIASTMEDSTDLGNYVLHQALSKDDIFEFEEDMRLMDIISSKDLYSMARKVLVKPTIHILLSQKERSDMDIDGE